MPRLNSVGSAVVATSGGPVSIDGSIPGALAAVTAAGPWHWLTDDIAAGLGNAGAGVKLLQYVVSTTTLSVLDAVASDASVAGGGTWAVDETATGVSTSVSGLGPLPGAGVLDAAATGELAVVLGLDTARGVRVYDSAGAEVVTLDSVLASLEVRLRGGRLAFRDAAGWHVWNLADATFDTIAQRTTVPTVLVPVLLTGGSVALVERTTTEITIRQAPAAVGYVLGGVVVDPDALELTPGVVRVAWATNVAQLAAQLVVADVDVAAGQITIGTVVAGAIVFGATTALTAAQIPADTAALAVTLDALLRQVLIDRRAYTVARQWVPWFAAVDRLIAGPVNLSRVTGVLQQANGGTGNMVGAVINAFGRIVAAGNPDALAVVPGDQLTVVAGLNITITIDPVARAVTIDASGSGADPDLTYLTDADETADLPNSRRLLAGTNVSFDDTTPGERTIDVTAGGDVVGPASAVNNDIAVFDGVTGTLLKDGGLTILQVIAAAVAASGDVVGPASAVNLRVAVFSGVTGKLIADGGQTIAAIIAAGAAAAPQGDVVGPASAVNLRIAVFSGVTGKLIADGGQTIAAVIAAGAAAAPQGDVVGPASAVNGNLAVFSGTSGKLIADGGAAPTGTNSGDVTLAGTPNYITIVGQVITRALIALASHVTGTLPVANGGTGQTAYTDGQLLIGNTGTGGLTKATLTPGTNITVTNAGGAITIAADGPGAAGLAFVTVTLTHAQILTLSSVPVELVAAPGAGMINVLVTAQASSDFTAGAYTNQTVRIRYAGVATDLVSGSTNTLNSATKRFQQLVPIATGAASAGMANAAIQISAGADPTGGGVGNQYRISVAYFRTTVL